MNKQAWASPFRYFQRPHDFSTYTVVPQDCALCGQHAAGYQEPFYGEADLTFVCEDCLLQGALIQVGCATNQGNEVELHHQLRQLNPNWETPAIIQHAHVLTQTLEQQTPHLVTWQEWPWPVHCGDYCCFLKEAGKPDLLAVASVDTVAELFPAEERTSLSDWWDAVREDSPSDMSESYDVAVYLFQCSHCETYIARWDAN